MAEAAVTFLLDSVAQILISYVDLIAGAENELEQLKTDLALLKSYLVEAGRKEKKEEQFRELERQIREVVYDAEDTLDTCLTEAAKAAAKKRTIFNRSRGPKRVSLAKQVKDLREKKMKPMFDKARDFAQMKIGDGSAADVNPTATKSAMIQLIREDNVVGFKDEQEKITGFLKEKTDELDVISIIGMAGLGKTTLAWKIFKDKAIQFDFPKCIWVYVSQEFDRRDVLLRILKAFTNLDMSGNTDQDIAQAVRAFLEDVTFLLVMDDVWTVEAWNALLPVLPKENKKSKVLITSRNRNVGTQASLNGKHLHDLRFLNKDESWELLRYEVFGKLKRCPDELKGMGEHIAHLCDGLPLTIVVIGGVLRDHYSKGDMSMVQNEWIKVSKNVNDYSISKINDKEKRILNAVNMSYKNLSEEMKNCFLYLGVFPEDHEIPAWTLAYLWIAEGFIQSKEQKSLEEIAEENLTDLINRNLVMVEKKNTQGKVKTCRVHDVIREFCNTKAGIKEQNLFREIKMNKGDFDPPVSEVRNYRRLCIHSHISKFIPQKQLTGPKVRSFLCCNKGSFTLEPRYISTIPEAFPLLRVLETRSFKFTHFPPRLPKLIHLRYITLSIDNLDTLPDSISELWNLQTLLVDTNTRTLKIEGNIWKLIQLRHLKTKAAILLEAQMEGDQACENLQIMTRVAPEYCTEKVLKRVCNIKKLGIRGAFQKLLNGGHSLNTLHSLENLKLEYDLLNEPPSDNPLGGFPQSNFFPSSLKRLTLSNTFLDWCHFATLGSIASLQVLKLKQNAFNGLQCNTVGNGFRALQFLLISNSGFGIWKAAVTDFPELRCLVLKNCEKLIEIPDEIWKRLHKLSVDCVGKSVVDRAKVIKADREIQGKQFDLTIGPGCE